MYLVAIDHEKSIGPHLLQGTFGVFSLATKATLTCAAIFSRHPTPTTLVVAAQTLASLPEKASKLLPTGDSRLSPASVRRLAKLLG
ncbi:hypothetical protein E2562_014948 [Oryza meyeriana var. granulata]|uniref:Uncharacterized protein n=1 Tax=Oryza meyeriana var. granulata TaxID=110450 RepID=A0A6G1ELK0_9ORYZ|nr:hypothetical protein E2562_014948 [Oryza meyeriana var. granulata]